jgi:hypothetical protein
MTLIPSLWKMASKARLNFVSRSWIRNRERWPLSSMFISRFARLLHDPGAVGVTRAGDVFDSAAADSDEDEHVNLGWLTRDPTTRAVRLTDAGRANLPDRLGVQLP